MAYNYGSTAALQALISKVEELIDSVRTIANSAQTAASNASNAATSASNTANAAKTTADAAKQAADAASGITLSTIDGTLPISKGGTGATSASAALTALGGAKRAYYTASVNTSWSVNSSGGYYKTITVSGILSTDVPVVGVVLSSTVSTAKLQGAAFACINRITTANNSITCYAYGSAPTTALTLQLLVIR